MRILVVEDDEPIAELIRQGLEEAQFEVEIASEGRDGLQKALDDGHSLIILDVMLPGIDGFSICETLRSRKRTVPVLMLTARDSVGDRVRGLDAGADDYLPKPFAFQELLARVRALLRRDKVHKGRVIHIADLVLDTATRSVTRAGQEISLTRREYELLEALAANEGRVLTRDLIRDEVWMDEMAFSNTVDVRIGLLRKKVDSGHEQRLIHTVHGVGYTLRQSPPGSDL